MEAGSISSKMVADAFSSATAAGGEFYGMTQKQAEGIKGLQAQLEGGLQDAFNNMGKTAEGAISIGYKGAISLVENYDTVGKVLIGLVATYGTYKAALVVINTLEKTNVAIMRQAVVEKNLAAMANIKLTSAEAFQIASKKMLTFHTANLTKALKAQALAMATNPAILMTAALVGLGWSVYKLATYESDLTKVHWSFFFHSTITTFPAIREARYSFDLLPYGCPFSGASIPLSLILCWVFLLSSKVTVSPSCTFTILPFIAWADRYRDRNNDNMSKVCFIFTFYVNLFLQRNRLLLPNFQG